MRSCAKKFYSINVYYKTVYDTLYILGLGKRKLQFYLNVFRKKTRLCYDLFPDNKKLLKKMFSTIFRSENFNRVQNIFFEKSTKDRVSHFNISVAVKRHSAEEHGQT